MAISVKDIQEKDFPVQDIGGYNIEQVDDFLDEIAEQLGALIRENLALTGHVSKLQEELDAKERSLMEVEAKTPDYNEAGYFKSLQSAMRETLIGAQRVADEATASAKAEADRLVDDAQNEARQTLESAKAEAVRITDAANKSVEQAKQELSDLKAAAESYRANFRKLVEEQLDTLKASDILFK